jgi:hypothetical protein
MNIEKATHWLIALGGAFVLAIAGASSALAQEVTTGTITGQVVDAQGLAIPGATVTVTSPQGRKTFLTDAEGRFHAPFLTPGRHALRIELEGFRPVTIERVDVSLGERVVLPNIMLRLGGVTEQVEVIGTPPVVDTTSTSIGTNLDSDFLARIPTQRQLTDVVYLAPGVSTSGDVGEANPSISGATGLENQYVIDGVNVSNPGYGGVGSYSIVFGSLGTGVPFDFVKEVQVKTGGYEAEFGQATGGVVQAVTKSGGNTFNGSTFATSSREASRVTSARRSCRTRLGGRKPSTPRRRSSATSASRPAVRSFATGCSSSARSIASGTERHSSRLKDFPSATSSAKPTGNARRGPIRPRAPTRPPPHTGSICRSSATRLVATWDRNAVLRSCGPIRQGSARSISGDTIKRGATRGCSGTISC